MTGIIATVGSMIASPPEINKLIQKSVVNYLVNYGLKNNSRGYLNLLHKMREGDQIPLKIYLELPGSRCRHMNKIGEIIEDESYILYDETAEIGSEKNYLVMSGLYDIMDNLAIGEKIYYEDGLCICSIKQIDKDKKRLLVSCDKACDANSIISEGSAVSFDGVDKGYKIIRQKDKKFLTQLKKAEIVPDYFLISFCKDKSDVDEARKEIETIFDQRINLLAKIQSKSSVVHIDEIIASTEGVVIERGDLIYIFDYSLPNIQRMVIEKAKKEKKLAIVASGFMSEFSRTSILNRSEQSDVYRLKEEGGDFLLLTKESGKAPHVLATIDAIQKILWDK